MDKQTLQKKLEKVGEFGKDSSFKYKDEVFYWRDTEIYKDYLKRILKEL